MGAAICNALIRFINQCNRRLIGVMTTNITIFTKSKLPYWHIKPCFVTTVWGLLFNL
jgi:hypothetical protein